jgi:hypothetical protein
MNRGPSFQVLGSERQTNPPPEGVEDATVTCWFCSFQPAQTQPRCIRCNCCFLPTKRTDGRPIAWYIGYFNSLQTPEERKIVLDRLTREFCNSTRNVAVCFKPQISGLSVVLRQLDGKRKFSIMTADQNPREGAIQDWSELRNLSTDVQRTLKLLVVNADRKCKFQSQ